MAKREIFETVDADGFATGKYHSTWIEAHVAALEMGLSVRRATLDTLLGVTIMNADNEPQEWTLEAILPESEM